MYNRQLETFLRIVEAGSFSKAAAELYISPSAVVQQINSLEASLDVCLFERTRQGVRMTEPGKYLAGEARDYIQKGKLITNQLNYLANRHNTICIGTSVFEKIHFLSDFWLAFARQGETYDIKLVNLDSLNYIPQEVEIIESVQDGMPWQSDWQFLKLCDMPLEIGVERHDGLSEAKIITAEDLRERKVFCLRRPGAKTEASISRELTENGIAIEWTPIYDRAVLWRCACEHAVIVLPQNWKDLMPDIIPIPYEKSFTMPYGIFYRKESASSTLSFIEFIEKNISGGISHFI